jgi:hypothetical protein
MAPVVMFAAAPTFAQAPKAEVGHQLFITE